MLLLPSPGNLSQMLGCTVLPHPPPQVPAYHTAWFIFRKSDTTRKRKRGMGDTYTRCPNLALKQKPLEIINLRSESALRMNCPLLTSLPHSEIRPAVPHPHPHRLWDGAVRNPGPPQGIRVRALELAAQTALGSGSLGEESDPSPTCYH